MLVIYIQELTFLKSERAKLSILVQGVVVNSLQSLSFQAVYSVHENVGSSHGSSEKGKL